jgi:hypothetical protein
MHIAFVYIFDFRLWEINPNGRHAPVHELNAKMYSTGDVYPLSLLTLLISQLKLN